MSPAKIAQYAIDNRYPKSEKEKVSDSEMFHFINESIQELLASRDSKSAVPSDIEIETWATYECGGCSQESNDERIGLISGAKWMRYLLTQRGITE